MVLVKPTYFKLTVLTGISFLFGCTATSVLDDISIVDICPKEFVTDYNEVSNRVEIIKKFEKEGRDSKSVRSRLEATCTFFFKSYSEDFVCIAKREKLDVLVKTTDYIALCLNTDGISQETKVPRKISDSNSP